MSKLLLALWCISLFALSGRVSAQESDIPPALAIDPATNEIVYIENGVVQVIAAIGEHDRFGGFWQTTQGPAVAIMPDEETVNLIPVAGETITFSVTGALRMPPTIVDDTAYYYDASNFEERFEDTYFISTPIMQVDLSSGVETADAGRALFSDGCAGMAETPPEEIVWSESGGFGSKRALERIETAGFDGFIGTLDACDRGVFAVDFGATDIDSPRILLEDVEDWVVSPNGVRVAALQLAAVDWRHVYVADVITGEAIVSRLGSYDRLAWLDDEWLMVGEQTETEAMLSSKMTAAEVEVYTPESRMEPEYTPIYSVRLVKMYSSNGEVQAFTEPFPDAYSFLRAYVYDDVIYAAVVPDGTAYASALLAAKATTSADDDEAARRWLMPVIYAVDVETGEFVQIADGYLHWTPVR